MVVAKRGLMNTIHDIAQEPTCHRARSPGSTSCVTLEMFVCVRIYVRTYLMHILIMMEENHIHADTC